MTHGKLVIAAPKATLACTGKWELNIRIDFLFETFQGRASDELLQSEFTEVDWLIIQPFDEVTFQGCCGRQTWIGVRSVASGFTIW
ncbi:hypothetical protein N9Z64_00235 [bacterium]|nr:hypothetical protein [bacterium]